MCCLSETAADDFNVYLVLSANKLDGVELQVMSEIDNVVVGVPDRSDRYQHNLVPVWIFILIVCLILFGVGGKPCLALIVAIDDETGYIVVFIMVVGVIVRRIVRGDVVCELVLLKECVHLALAHHEQYLWNTKLVSGTGFSVVSCECNLG